MKQKRRQERKESQVLLWIKGLSPYQFRTFRLESLTGRCHLQKSNINRSSLWKTINCVIFHSYVIGNSTSPYGSLRRGGGTWRINFISNSIARFSIYCVPSITWAFVWTHGILTYGIDVTGMGISGTFIQVKKVSTQRLLVKQHGYFS